MGTQGHRFPDTHFSKSNARYSSTLYDDRMDRFIFKLEISKGRVIPAPDKIRVRSVRTGLLDRIVPLQHKRSEVIVVVDHEMGTLMRQVALAVQTLSG